MENLRYFPNDYEPNYNNYSDKDYDSIYLTILNQIDIFYSKVKPDEIIATSSKLSKSKSDFALYEGSAGHFFAYVKLASLCSKNCMKELEKNEEIYKKLQIKSQESKEYALRSFIVLDQYIVNLFKNQTEKNISFYFGSIGFYLTAIPLFIDSFSQAKYCILKIMDTLANFKKYQGLIYHELLYGTSGLLYCLLKLQSLIVNESELKKCFPNLESEIYDLVIFIHEAGLEKAPPPSSASFRLSYNFYGDEYLGAAHGLFGILYILCTAYMNNKKLFEEGGKEKREKTQKLLSDIKRSFHFCCDLQFKSGNFPAGTSKQEKDYLVQFCHGSSGAIPSLIRGFELFGEKRFLEAAEKAGENVWECGLLKKGFGLCHGISGNGYFFLSLYRFNKDFKWLIRALHFANELSNDALVQGIENYECPGRLVKGKSDFPFSLMNGVAGDIVYLLDLLTPLESK